jgi:hypothetical protein
MFIFPPEPQINGCFTDRQLAQRNLREPRRKRRVNVQSMIGGIRLQSENGLQ